MSEPVSALAHATHQGFVDIAEIGPLGMITLRCDLGQKPVATALKSLGLPVPATRRMVQKGEFAAGWMSPDELLVLAPYAEVGPTLEKITKAMKGHHFLAADVSDARAVFRITGPQAGQVLSKLCPVDLAALQPGELRRTRAAQVAAAFWADGDGFTLVSFRSVADYVMGLLRHSAQPGSELDAS